MKTNPRKRKIRTKKKPWYRKWATFRRITATIFLTVLILGQFDFFPWFKGTTSGTTLLGVIPLTDPLAGLEVLAAAHTLTITALLGMAILISAAVLFGPVFCGFVCPLGFVLDLNQSLRWFLIRKVGHRHTRHAVPDTVPGWVRFALLGVLLGFAMGTGLPIFQALSPINLFVRALVMGSWLGLTVVGAILALEWFLPRVWCRSMCPLGACYSVLGRKAIWRVRINPQTAGQIRCKQCQIRCPMGIPIMTDYTLAGQTSITHPSCIRCGDCIDVCPNTVLGLRVRPFPSSKPPCIDQSGKRDVHLPVLEAQSIQREVPVECESCYS